MKRFGLTFGAVAFAILPGLGDVSASPLAKAPTPPAKPVTCEAAFASKPLFQQKNITFPLCAYEASLKGQLANKVVGYSWAAVQHGVLIGEGAGGLATVATNTPMTANTSMDIFSASKTITAMAVLKAIEKLQAQGKAITVESKITPFLPSNWTFGPHVKDVTFRDVLTHAAGFRSVSGAAGTTPCFYANLKTMIANGSTDANFHKGQYDDANYCVLRIAIAYMVKGAAHYKQYEAAGHGNDEQTGQDYLKFCKDSLFAPTGIAADIAPADYGSYPHYYNFNNTLQVLGEQSRDNDIIDGGATYWNLTAPHLAMFMWDFAQGKIVSPASFAIMCDTKSPDPALATTRLGLYQTPTATATWYGHSGGVQIGQIGASTIWQLFPDDVVLTLYINSNGGLNDANGNGIPAYGVQETAWHVATKK